MINPHTLLLLVAFVAFIIAAIDWKGTGLRLIAFGLAMLVLSMLIGRG